MMSIKKETLYEMLTNTFFQEQRIMLVAMDTIQSYNYSNVSH